MSEETQAPVVQAKQPEMRVGGAIQPIVPQTLDELWRVAGIFHKSKMVPESLDTQEKVMVALMQGQEVGMPAMAALQSIAIIKGRPTIWGDGALGLVQGSGKMEWIKEWIEGEGDTRTGHCHMKRRGDIEIKKNSFSVAQAKKAKLWGKAGPWTDYPDRMLIMRPRSWSMRDGFSDVLKGLGIAEEVMDIPPEQTSFTVVETTAHEQQGVDLKLPSVKTADAETAQPVAEAEQSVDPAPGVKYLDRVVKVHEVADKAAGKTKYGIQTKALGSKALLGTYDAALAQVAVKALADQIPVDVVYSQEDGKKPVLVSIEAVK